jgi:endoglucanase
MTIVKRTRAVRAILLCAVIAISVATHQNVAHPADKPALAILSNGDFQLDADGDGVPDGWAEPKGGVSFPIDGTNRFLRLASPKPDEMVMTYRLVRIPKGVRPLSWKQRTANLKVGKQSWFDARIMLQFKNAAGEKVAGSPPAPNTNKNSDGWIEKNIKFLAPDDAVILEFMPALFRVESGTFDLDDIVLKETDPAPVAAAAKAKAEADADKLAKNVEKRQAAAAAKAGPDRELIANGNFQAEGKGGVPDKWSKLKDDLTWQKEGNNRFLRLVSPAPGKLVMFYHAVDLPKGTKALEFKWSQRISNFKRGKENYFDARIIFQWLDAAGHKLTAAHPPATAQKNLEGWAQKSERFLAPDGALTLVIMPALFQVESGTFDLDNLSLKAIDPAPLIAAAEAKAAEEKAAIVAPEPPNQAKWPPELRVAGNKVLDKDGKEVWLQGVNVDSLQWNARGERVMRSALVAMQDWKANVLRLPIQDKFWFGKDPSQKDAGKAYRELVENIVNLAANRGAYVMLDLHRFRAPKQEHVDFWKDVATKYKNHPAVVFELFNEPHGTSWEVWRDGGFVEDSKALADEDAFLTPAEKALNKKGFHSVGMQALIDTVRGVGAKNIVIAGGLDWAYDLSGVANGFALAEKGGNGLMFAAHIYAQKTNWLGKVMIVADKYPIIVSECGANTKKFTFMPAEAQEDAETWVPRFLGFIQKNQLHWTAFSMHPGSAPMLISDWKFTPTPEWGAHAKRALAGEKFPAPEKLR